MSESELGRAYRTISGGITSSEATPRVASVEAALRDRARHLLSLTKGWDSYGGEPIDPETVDKAVDVALALAHQFPTYPPQLVPCSDGSVQIEWHAGGWDAELWLMKHEPALATEPAPQATPWECRGSATSYINGARERLPHEPVAVACGDPCPECGGIPRPQATPRKESHE